MATGFRPKRFPMRPEDYDLDTRLRHIEDALTGLGGSAVNPNTQANSPLGSSAAASAGQTASGGGGGGGGAVDVLGGDVTGQAVNNTVSSLQAVTLTLTSLSTGQVLTYNGTALVNSSTISGSITLTGSLTSGNGNSLGSTTFTGDVTLSAHNLVTDGTTGTKLGTTGGAAGQKLAAFGSTPITQPLLATGAGHTVDDVISVLQSLGWCRQS